MILLEMRERQINGIPKFFVRVSFNKKLIDLSGLCPVTDGDRYQCPYEMFKRIIEKDIVLPLAAEEYCGAPELPPVQRDILPPRFDQSESFGSHQIDFDRLRRQLQESGQSSVPLPTPAAPSSAPKTPPFPYNSPITSQLGAQNNSQVSKPINSMTPVPTSPAVQIKEINPILPAESQAASSLQVEAVSPVSNTTVVSFSSPPQNSSDQDPLKQSKLFL